MKVEQKTNKGGAANYIEGTGIWIGGKMDAFDENVVFNTDRRIPHVLNATGDVKTLFDVNYEHGKIDGTMSPNYHRYLRCDLNDVDDIRPFISDAFVFINEALNSGTHVLVHCRCGVNRSMSIVVAYLVLEKRMSLDSALELVKRHRGCSCPGVWFVKQIQEEARMREAHAAA
jgi:protein-tyrosine phosphatase